MLYKSLGEVINMTQRFWDKIFASAEFVYGEEERNEGERHTGLAHIIQVALQKNKGA